MVSLTSLLGAVSAAAVVVQALPPVFRVVRTSDEAALDRRQSSDPACPAGFVCSGGPCPSDVACEAGETCVNFGGTIGCVPSGSKVCAVQPTSLEAVICLAENGVCCHGSCYAAGAVCCDFPGVQCSFGVPCPDVCPSGQTCGSTACVGGGASSSSSTTTTTTSTTTSKPPTLPPPSTSMPPTAEPTSTVSPPSAPSSTAPPSTTTSSTTIAPPTTPSTTTTTSSTPASASSSTAPSPSGPSVGSFRLDGCFLDDPVIRALQNGSSTSSDMTVEKCVSLADGWRYAGLEHGTQCYWGDVLIFSEPASPLDCNAPCGGNASEICGGATQLSLYEDTDFVAPSDEELVDALTEYQDALDQLRDAVANFYQLVTLFNAQSPNKTTPAPAVSSRSLAARHYPQRLALREEKAPGIGRRAIPVLSDILSSQALIRDRRQVLAGASSKIRRRYRQARVAGVATEAEEMEMQRLITQADGTAAVVEEAPVADAAAVAAAEDAAADAVVAIGAPEIVVGAAVAVAAVGFFDGLFHLFSHHRKGSGSSSGNMTMSASATIPFPTPSPTSSQAPEPTGPLTERVVLFTPDMSSAQYFVVLAGLTVRGNVIVDLLATPETSFYAFLAFTHDDDARLLSKHPFIASIGLNAESLPPDEFGGATSAAQVAAAKNGTEAAARRRRETAAHGRRADGGLGDGGDGDGPERAANATWKRDLDPVDAVEEALLYNGNIAEFQPFHLQWLTGLWAFGPLQGTYSFFDRYVMDDSINARIPVYVIDSGVLQSHEDFHNPRFPQAFRTVIDVTPGGNGAGRGQDVDGHGTAMAGCVAGAVSGVYKDAEIIPCKAYLGNGQFFNVWNVLRTLERVTFAQIQRGIPPAVVSMSIGQRLDLFVDPALLGSPADPYGPVLRRLYTHFNAVVVLAAGNSPGQDLRATVPQFYGGANTPIIVVGNADSSGNRYPTSSFLDDDQVGVLSIYFHGQQVLTPWINPLLPYRYVTGTSPAAAQAAGYAARLLAEGVAPNAVKQEMRTRGRQLKGNVFEDDDGLFAPRAALNVLQTCSPALTGIPVPTPTWSLLRREDAVFAEATPVFGAPISATVQCYSKTSDIPPDLVTVAVNTL